MCIATTIQSFTCNLIIQFRLEMSFEVHWTILNCQCTMKKKMKKKDLFHCLLILFYNFIAQLGFLPWEIWVAFPGKSQL